MQQSVAGGLQNSSNDIEIVIRPRSMLMILSLCISFFATLGVVSAYLFYILKHSWAALPARLFMLDLEANLPTLFSFGLLLFCSLMLFLITLKQSSLGAMWRWHWVFLTGLFFVMAFDEAAGVHEHLILPVRETLNATGWFFFAWVVPAWIFVAVFSLVYLRFLLALPKPFMRLFILSGALYVGGALGVEMPGGAYAELHGTDTFAFQMIATAEEVLEMGGLALFSYTLIRFLAIQREPLCLMLRAR